MKATNKAAINEAVSRGTQGHVHSDLCYVFDECYDFEITERHLASAPTWNPSAEPNPPFPAAVALARAQGFISSFSFPFAGSDLFYWELENLSLIPVARPLPGHGDPSPAEQAGHWAWSARYRLKQKSFMSGSWPHVDCWVLMDGTVIEPHVRPCLRG